MLQSIFKASDLKRNIFYIKTSYYILIKQKIINGKSYVK